MKINTEISHNLACDWASVKCTYNSQVTFVNIFVPLAEKKYPNLSTDAAIAKAARKRFKQPGMAFNGYE